MMDCHLNANNVQLSFGVYCQVAENAKPRYSLAPRTSAAISLGNSGNLSGGQMFFVLDTGLQVFGLVQQESHHKYHLPQEPDQVLSSSNV